MIQTLLAEWKINHNNTDTFLFLIKHFSCNILIATSIVTLVCWIFNLSDWFTWQWLGSEYIFGVFHPEAVLRWVTLSVDL